jgi:hypothetical protein
MIDVKLGGLRFTELDATFLIKVSNL